MWKKNIIFYVYQLEFIISAICILLVQCNETNTVKQHEDIFRQMFKMRRAEQLEAVKKMRQLQPGRQQKMVEAITKTIFDVILKSRVVLENSGYTPGVSAFPQTEVVRDALSMILENTALLGDIILRLPDIAEPVLRSTTEWPVLYAWSLSFANQTQLLDNNTVTLINLVSQELNITKRSPDYINPYRNLKDKQKVNPEPVKEVKKKKKRAEIPRGPRLTLPQMGEL